MKSQRKHLYTGILSIVLVMAMVFASVSVTRISVLADGEPAIEEGADQGQQTENPDNPEGEVPGDQGGSDVVNDQPGDDVVNDQPGGDVVNDQPGGDVVNDQPGGDVVNDQPGGDVVNDQPGDDVVNDQPGDDVVNDQPGDDVVNDQPGDDVVNDQPGNDIVNEQPGDDVVNDQPAAAPAAVTDPAQAADAQKDRQAEPAEEPAKKAALKKAPALRANNPDDPVSIGANTYPNLREAVAAAINNDGVPIVVNKSYTEPDSDDILIDKIITIQGSGSVTATGAHLHVTAGGGLTLGGSGTLTLTEEVDVTDGGSITFQDGIVLNNTLAIYGSGSEGTITGGTITVSDAGGCAIDVGEGATVSEISGGTFTNTSGTAMAVRGTVTKITGENTTFKSGGVYSAVAVNPVGTINTIENGKFIADHAQHSDEKLTIAGLVVGGHVDTISGGTFQGAQGAQFGWSNLDGTGAKGFKGDLKITGGTFKGLSNVTRAYGLDIGARTPDQTGTVTISNAQISSMGDSALVIAPRNNVSSISGVTCIAKKGGSALWATAFDSDTDNKWVTIGSISGTFITNDTLGGAGIHLEENTTVTEITDVQIQSSAHGIYLDGHGTGKIPSVGKISGGTVDAGDNDEEHCGIRNQGGTIGEITGPTVSGMIGIKNMSVDDGGAVGGTITLITGTTSAAGSKYGIDNSGTITLINGATTAEGGESGVANDGTIETIEAGTFTGTGYSGLDNIGTITSIKGGTFTGASEGCYNWDTGSIDEISGGTFDGDGCGINNFAEIGTISGGNYTGLSDYGIACADYSYVIDDEGNIVIDGETGKPQIEYFGDGRITRIVISKDAGSVFTGGKAAVGSFFGGTIKVITGYGIFNGSSDAVLFNDSTDSLPNLERTDDVGMDLEETGQFIGNGRYLDPAVLANSLDNWHLPTGYHMSRTTTTVSGHEGTYHFLTKDNTIIYDGNGHSLTEDKKHMASTDISGSDPVVRPYDLEKGVEGNGDEESFKYEAVDAQGNELTFLGWATTPDGEGADFYNPGDKIENLTDIRLYAQWGVKITYKVSDERGNVTLNGSTEEPSAEVSEDLAPNDAVAEGLGLTVDPQGALTAPTDPENNHFLYWVDENGTQVSTDKNFVPEKPAGNATYTAVYTNLWHVSFDTDGGKPVPETAPVVEGDQVPKPQEPTKPGYTFDGWIDTETGEPFDFTTPITKPYKLKAVWKTNQYVVKFEKNSDSASGTMEDQAREFDDGKALTKNAFKRPGYTFTGWNTKPDGSGTGYADEATDNLISDKEPSVTLYAQWSANEAQLVYNANGGTGKMDPTPGKTNDEVTVAKNNFTRDGYMFVKWNTKPDGEGNNYKPDDKYKLTADTPHTLYAIWTPIVYTVDFESNGGSKVDSVKQPYGTLVKTPTPPTKEGNKLDGWYKDKELKQPFDFTKDKVTGDMTLYAKWTPIEYTITYNFNGGTRQGSKGPLKQKYPYGKEIVIISAPTREGYTFKHWEGSEYHPGDTYTVKGDHTFTAQWDRKATPTPTASPKSPSSGGGGASGAGGSPKTGDTSHMGIWLILLIAAAACAGAIIFISRRRNR